MGEADRSELTSKGVNVDVWACTHAHAHTLSFASEKHSVVHCGSPLRGCPWRARGGSQESLVRWALRLPGAALGWPKEKGSPPLLHRREARTSGPLDEPRSLSPLELPRAPSWASWGRAQGGACHGVQAASPAVWLQVPETESLRHAYIPCLHEDTHAHVHTRGTSMTRSDLCLL